MLELYLRADAAANTEARGAALVVAARTRNRTWDLQLSQAIVEIMKLGRDE
jgi:hypothetical protein